MERNELVQLRYDLMKYKIRQSINNKLYDWEQAIEVKQIDNVIESIEWEIDKKEGREHESKHRRMDNVN